MLDLKSLSTNKPLMDQKLYALYDSAFRQAAYNAYYNTHDKLIPSIDFGTDDPDLIEQANARIAKNKSDFNDELIIDSNKFADEFVNQLKSAKLLETISDEIDGHIKAMKLLITMLPQGIATLISPMGPCSGSMIISDETANINIL
jgi:hypothetical protein